MTLFSLVLCALLSPVHATFVVSGEEGLSLERLTEMRQKEVYDSLRIHHSGVGNLSVQTTEAETLKVRAQSGKQGALATIIKGAYDHIDIDLPPLEPWVTAEIYIPRKMVFDNLQITSQEADLEVSGRFEASRPEQSFIIKTGPANVRINDLQYAGEIEILSLTGNIALSNSQVKSALARSFGSARISADTIQADALHLETDNGALAVTGPQNNVYLHITKAGTAHIDLASFAGPLKVQARLSQAGSSCLTIARSYMPQGVRLKWDVQQDDFPEGTARIMQIEKLDITYGDLLKYNGLTDLQEHLKARGANEICERLFYCPPVSWHL